LTNTICSEIKKVMPEVSPQPSLEKPDTPSQPQESKGISWKKILVSVGVIAVVVGIIAGGLYWYFVLNEEETSTTETTKATTPSAKKATPSAEKEKDETADWKNYSHEEFGYKLKYPPNWILDEEIKEGCGTVFWAPNKKGGWITICTTPGGDSFEDVASNLATGEVVSKTEKTLGGRNAIRQELKIVEQELEFLEIQVIGSSVNGETPDFGSLYVSLYVTDEEFLEQLKADFNKIVQTFEFLP
jgi:hypothetical protein